jgi:hypothetical protein
VTGKQPDWEGVMPRFLDLGLELQSTHLVSSLHQAPILCFASSLRLLRSLQHRLVTRLAPPNLVQSLSASDQPPMRTSLFGGNLKRIFLRLAGLA